MTAVERKISSGVTDTIFNFNFNFPIRFFPFGFRRSGRIGA
jgi:hypothetical protein